MTEPQPRRSDVGSDLHRQVTAAVQRAAAWPKWMRQTTAAPSPSPAEAAEIERLRTCANSARVLLERHLATHPANELLATALRELDDAMEPPR